MVKESDNKTNIFDIVRLNMNKSMNKTSIWNWPSTKQTEQMKNKTKKIN